MSAFLALVAFSLVSFGFLLGLAAARWAGITDARTTRQHLTATRAFHRATSATADRHRQVRP